MFRSLIDMGLNHKVGIMTISSPFVVKMLAALQWIDTNITQIGFWISALVGISLFVSHVCKTIWDNRKNREESRKSEVEIEELKLRVELLKLELREKQEDNKE